MNLIPPSLKKQKLRLSANLSLVDLGLMIIYFLITVSLVIALPFSLYIKFVVGFSTFIFMCMTLIHLDKFDKKVYQVIFLAFKFLSQKKKYTYNEANTTSLLIPYRKIEGNCIKTNILQGSTAWYIGAIEIKGFNLSTLDIDEQMQKLNQMGQAFRMLDCNMSLVKYEKPYSFSKNIQYLKNVKDNLKKDYEKGKISELGYISRIKQINGYIKTLRQNDKSVSIMPNRTFVLYIYAKSLESVKRYINIAKYKLGECQLQCKEYDKYDLVNSIKLLFAPFDIPFTKKEIDDNKNNLPELLAFEDIIFNANHFKIGEMLYSINSIRSYPTTPNNGWLANIMSSESTVMVNLTTPSNESVKEQLNSAMRNMRSNMMLLRKQINFAEKEYEYAAIENLMNEVAAGQEKVKRMNVLFLNYGYNSKMLLKQQEQSLDLLLKNNSMAIDSLIYNQLEGYSGFIPKFTDPIALTNSHEIPCSTLGNGFPFLNNSIQEEKGLLLGYNTTGDIVFADQFKRGGDYQNSNAFFIGTTGSGKTTTVSKLLNFHISLGRKVIVIDPKREFGHLCKYYDGNWIDAGSGTNGHFNPLQITQNIDEYNKLESVVGQHLQNLETFFQFTHSYLSKEELSYLTQIILDYYNEHDLLSRDKINANDNNLWPTFSDLYEFFEGVSANPKEKILLDRLKSIIKNDFTGFGKYAALWNQKSTVNTGDNLLTIFDIQTLYSRPVILKAQMFLILNFIRAEINNNRFKTKNELILAVDEAHIVIDKDNPQALKFLFETIKMIRGFNGGVVLVTQNLSDFRGSNELERETTAMLNNAQYVGILKLKQKDLQDINELYRASGGLSDNEIFFCASAKRGDMLFMMSDYNRHCLHVEISKSEQEAIGIKIKRD